MRILPCLFLLFALPVFGAETATAPAEKSAPAAKTEPGKSTGKSGGKTSAGKAPLLGRFEKTCLQNAASEGRSQKELCGCLKTNLGAKLNAEQLSLLVRFYEGDVEAKTTVQKAENAALLDFDMEAADHCMEDPHWKAPAGPLQDDDSDDALPPAKEKGPPPAGGTKPAPKAEKLKSANP